MRPLLCTQPVRRERVVRFRGGVAGRCSEVVQGLRHRSGQPKGTTALGDATYPLRRSPRQSREPIREETSAAANGQTPGAPELLVERFSDSKSSTGALVILKC